MSELDKYIFKQITDEPGLKDRDLPNYAGCRYELQDGKGNVIESSDDRDLETEKAKKLSEFKQAGFKEAAEALPINEQVLELMKFATGLQTREELIQALAPINNVRSKYQAKKAAVIAAATLDELEVIVWDN